MAKAEPISGLRCEADAAVGARLVLMNRVREMIGLREMALDWSDPEGVHDMRVVSRRLRSALRDFSSALPKRDSTAQGRASKVFANSLGGVRDEDVAIIALEKLRRDTPVEAQAGVEALIAERAERREAARVHLTGTITPERLAKLLQLFIESFGSTDEGSKLAAKGEVRVGFTFRDLGRERIGKQFRRLGKRAVCLYRPTAYEEHHELRIEAKRLRYALELFGVCWDHQLTPFSEQVAELQGALGDLHDCDEWINILGHKLIAFHTSKRHVAGDVRGGKENAAVQAACLWLLDHFAKERTKHYRQALSIWAQWQASDFGARLTSGIETKQ